MQINSRLQWAQQCPAAPWLGDGGDRQQLHLGGGWGRLLGRRSWSSFLRAWGNEGQAVTEQGTGTTQPWGDFGVVVCSPEHLDFHTHLSDFHEL